jgi:quinol monooxygenase YgiN
MISLLRASAENMSGCLTYLIAEDVSDPNVLWVTEVWDTQASHEASLALPAVKTAMVSAKSLVARFENVAVTVPIVDVGAQAVIASGGVPSGQPPAPSA